MDLFQVGFQLTAGYLTAMFAYRLLGTIMQLIMEIVLDLVQKPE